MDETKHDLSAGEATLNLEDLITTASIAFASKREELNRRIHKLYNIESPDYKYEAHWAKEDAKYMAQAAETLYVLQESRHREIKIIK